MEFKVSKLSLKKKSSNIQFLKFIKLYYQFNLNCYTVLFNKCLFITHIDYISLFILLLFIKPYIILKIIYQID